MPLAYVTGKTVSGVISRNITNVIPIPNSAPNNQSVGWSTPRYMRASPRTRITASVDHSHRARIFPSGIRQSAIPTNVADRNATGADGMENPDQSPRIGMPSGRSRPKNSASDVPNHPTTSTAAMNVRRCRHRRNTISSTIVIHRRARSTLSDPSAATPCATCVSQGVRTATIRSSIHWSIRSRNSGADWKNVAISPTTRPNPSITSQNFPLALS